MGGTTAQKDAALGKIQAGDYVKDLCCMHMQPNRGGPQRAHRRYTGGQGDPPPKPPKPRKVGKTIFLRGFWGKLAFPKASWVPYNPFGSREIP